MRGLVQRVSSASVTVDGECLGRIGPGLLVYVGIAETDKAEDARKLADKIAGLRIFEDKQGKLNLSVGQVGGNVLAISNFTLQGDTRKGRRPSFVNAMSADQAQALHEEFLRALRDAPCAVETGRFGAEMFIQSVAAGPVNVLVEVPS
jgi:D-tyrosyl-tRNA(Tyr) deacylase